jgi:hypothetical protein
MPSERLLCMYKNSLPQKPGLNLKMLEWMLFESKRSKLPLHAVEGGLLFDEMAIEVGY